LHRLDSGRGRRLARASDGTSLDSEVDRQGLLHPLLQLPLLEICATKTIRPPIYSSPLPSIPNLHLPHLVQPIDRFPPWSLPNLQTEPVPISSGNFLRLPKKDPPSLDGVSFAFKIAHPDPNIVIYACSYISAPFFADLHTSTYTSGSTSFTVVHGRRVGWETASATTSTSTTSAPSSDPLSPLQMNPRSYFHFQNDMHDKNRQRRFLSSESRYDEPDADAPDDADADDQDLDLDISQGELPHIPLRSVP